MSQKITCHCGAVIDLSVIPTKGEFAYISSETWDDLVESLSAVVSEGATRDIVLLREALNDALAVRVSYFYKCQKCSRLILKPPTDEQYEFYLQDK